MAGILLDTVKYVSYEIVISILKLIGFVTE